MSSTKDVKMNEMCRQTIRNTVNQYYACLILVWTFIGSEGDEVCIFENMTPGRHTVGATLISEVNNRTVCEEMCARNPLCVAYQTTNAAGTISCWNQNMQSALSGQMIVDNTTDEYVKPPGGCPASETSLYPMATADEVTGTSAVNVTTKAKKVSKSRRLLIIALIAIVVIGGFVACVGFAHCVLVQKRQNEDDEKALKIAQDAAQAQRKKDEARGQKPPQDAAKLQPKQDESKGQKTSQGAEREKLINVTTLNDLKKTESKMSVSRQATTASKTNLQKKKSTTGVKFTPIETTQLRMSASGKIQKPIVSGENTQPTTVTGVPVSNQVTKAPTTDVPVPNQVTKAPTTDVPVPNQVTQAPTADVPVPNQNIKGPITDVPVPNQATKAPDDPLLQKVKSVRSIQTLVPANISNASIAPDQPSKTTNLPITSKSDVPVQTIDPTRISLSQPAKPDMNP